MKPAFNRKGHNTNMRYCVFFLLATVLSLGCVRGGPRYTYDEVIIHFNIETPPTQGGWRYTEYKIQNNEVSSRYVGWDGESVREKKGTITDEQYRELGKKVVEAGVYGMADDMISRASGAPGEDAIAALHFSIDGHNKTITIKPYSEQYLAGNLRRILAEIRYMMQRI
jgi:hypothetical protein